MESWVKGGKCEGCAERLVQRPSSPAAAAGETQYSENRNAAAVGCSDWFGPSTRSHSGYAGLILAFAALHRGSRSPSGR